MSVSSLICSGLNLFTSYFQNTEKSKDWYKTMFKQIHRIPGKRKIIISTCCMSVEFVCSHVCFYMLCHVLLCLSITVLRAYWGKPLPPHLHFSREQWHSDEIKRYPMVVTPLSLDLLICSHPGPFQILELYLICCTWLGGKHRTTYLENALSIWKAFT